MSTRVQTEIDRKLAGKMALASRAFLWLTVAGIAAALIGFAYVQRWFTPTIDLYFYTQHAGGLSRGMAVKLIGFNIGSLEEISRTGELRVRGKISIASEHRNVIGKDSRIRLTKEGVLGAYILEVVPGQGDMGPVEEGNTLEYEREVDYSMMVTNLIDRIGPVLDEIRKVSAQLGDPDAGVRQTLRRLDEVGLSFVQAGRSISKFGADGSKFAADASRVTNELPARMDPIFVDLQRNLAQIEVLVKQLNASVPPMLDDSRKLLQSLTATSNSLQKIIGDDVPRVLRRTEAAVQDTEEIIGGVKRSWPVKNMLAPETSEKPVELDSADGAVHVPPERVNAK